MGSKERVINIMEIGSLVPFKFYVRLLPALFCQL